MTPEQLNMLREAHDVLLDETAALRLLTCQLRALQAMAPSRDDFQNIFLDPAFKTLGGLKAATDNLDAVIREHGAA